MKKNEKKQEHTQLASVLPDDIVAVYVDLAEGVDGNQNRAGVPAEQRTKKSSQKKSNFSEKKVRKSVETFENCIKND
jgi:hypothetical protein